MKMLLLAALLLPSVSFADSSHVNGKGIEEMLELVTKHCVIDTCRADNANRQMTVLSEVPESSWNLTAEEIEEILDHSDAGVYDQDINGVYVTWCGHHIPPGAGPHRFILRSIPMSSWRRFDRGAVEEIVGSLTRQADRLLAINLWMDAHRSEQ